MQSESQRTESKPYRLSGEPQTQAKCDPPSIKKLLINKDDPKTISPVS